jgi:hypothetical protein
MTNSTSSVPGCNMSFNLINMLKTILLRPKLFLIKTFLNKKNKNTRVSTNMWKKLYNLVKSQKLNYNSLSHIKGCNKSLCIL